MRILDDVPVDETLVEELIWISLGQTEEVWVILSDTVEESWVLTVVTIKELDGEGTRVEEIPDDNESDDATAVEADNDISKEAGEENKTKSFNKISSTNHWGGSINVFWFFSQRSNNLLLTIESGGGEIEDLTSGSFHCTWSIPGAHHQHSSLIFYQFPLFLL